MQGTMPPHTDKENNRWLLLQLWGLDTPITAICWAVACAALLQITMMTAGPLLLVASGVWCVSMWVRISDALKSDDAWQAPFYRSNLALLSVLLLATGLATTYMLFFYVGRAVLDYCFLPAGLFLGSRLCSHPSLQAFRQLLQALGFAMVCAMPAFYFSFTLTPLHMLVTGPVWYLGLLFYLTARERRRLKTGESHAHDAVLNTITLLLLLTISLLSSMTAPMFERTLCVTIAIGAGCLQGFCRLNHLVSPQRALALSWLTMALPAVLGIILYAPHSW